MRPPHVNARAVSGSLYHADLLKLNASELTAVQQAFDGPVATGELIPWLMERFSISTLALTRGSHGSSLYHRHMEISRPAESTKVILDTVGAGDGYAALLAAGRLLGRPWDLTVEQATRFAGRICGIRGAIPDDEAFYDDFRQPMKTDS
jgi:fructokinase